MKETLGIVMFVTGLGVLVDVFTVPPALVDLVGPLTIGWGLLLCGLGILAAVSVKNLRALVALPAQPEANAQTPRSTASTALVKEGDQASRPLSARVIASGPGLETGPS